MRRIRSDRLQARHHAVRTAWMACLILAAGPLAAQPSARVGLAAGTATDERGIRSNAVTVTPSVTLSSSPRLQLILAGSATRFESAAWTAGGAAGVGMRSPAVGGLALSVGAGGNGWQSSFGTTAASGEVTPTAEWAWRTVTLFGGARVATAWTHGPLATAQPPVPGRPTVVTVTRTLRGAVFGGQWSPFGAAVRWPVSLAYHEERSAVADVHATERRVGASVQAGPLSVGASAGRRAGTAQEEPFGTVGVTFTLFPGVDLEASAGRYPSDRLTGAAAGRFASAGIAWRFGGPRSLRLPEPKGVARPRAGVTRIAIHAPDARTVQLCGDWNGWKPEPARRASNGVWYVDLALEPGEYRYAFRVNGAWRVPEGAVAVDDGFGGRAAYVTVPRRSAGQ